jgi:hypothetical protein
MSAYKQLHWAPARPTNQQPRRVMKANPTSFIRCVVDFSGWLVPGAIVALIPKCPVCLAAYIALWTGIGMSISAAIHLRASLVALCAGWLLFLVVRNAYCLIYKKTGNNRKFTQINTNQCREEDALVC